MPTDKKKEKRIYVRQPDSYEELLAIMASEQRECKDSKKWITPNALFTPIRLDIRRFAFGWIRPWFRLWPYFRLRIRLFALYFGQTLYDSS